MFAILKEPVLEKKVDPPITTLHGLTFSPEEADKRFEALLRRLGEKVSLLFIRLCSISIKIPFIPIPELFHTLGKGEI